MLVDLSIVAVGLLIVFAAEINSKRRERAQWMTAEEWLADYQRQEEQEEDNHYDNLLDDDAPTVALQVLEANPRASRKHLVELVEDAIMLDLNRHARQIVRHWSPLQVTAMLSHPMHGRERAASDAHRSAGRSRAAERRDVYHRIRVR